MSTRQKAEMQPDTLRTMLQAATLAVVSLGALAGLGVWAIDAIVAQEVRPLQEKVATLEQQSAAIVALEARVNEIEQDVAVLVNDSEWIKNTLTEIKNRLPPLAQ